MVKKPDLTPKHVHAQKENAFWVFLYNLTNGPSRIEVWKCKTIKNYQNALQKVAPKLKLKKCCNILLSNLAKTSICIAIQQKLCSWCGAYAIKCMLGQWNECLHNKTMPNAVGKICHDCNFHKKSLKQYEIIHVWISTCHWWQNIPDCVFCWISIDWHWLTWACILWMNGKFLSFCSNIFIVRTIAASFFKSFNAMLG